MSVDPVKIAEGLALLGLGTWTILKERQARRARKREAEFTEEFDLEENPRRCAAHAKAINEIRGDIQRIKEHLGIV